MFWFRQQVRITPEYAAMARQALRLRYWTVYAFYGATVRITPEYAAMARQALRLRYWTVCAFYGATFSYL
ncbi:Cameo1 [Operophtera brumata]|uniref:Cameo1 n=1 Tax=Operophtera brumata TaxID=104452 RepID=A0A0L7LUS1_OPEBR|nr:Cameo1 [Operophtera brumata]